MIPSYEQISALLTAPGRMFEIEQRTIAGVPLRTWKNAPLTLRQVLESTRKFNDRIFISYESEQLTYAEHNRRVALLATRLSRDLKVRKGDRVAIAMRNFPEWSIAFWAIVSIGAIAVPLNAWWTAEELDYALRDSGASVLFADPERALRLEGKLPSLALSGLIVARTQGQATPHIKLEDLLSSSEAEPSLPTASIDPEDPATILYTSGTTGRPKGALGTHRNICSVITTLGFLGVRALLRAGGALQDLAQMQNTQQVFLLTVPLFHVAGCHGVLVTTFASGGRVVMMYKWDAQLGLELIERERVTAINAIPTMVWQLLERPEIATRDLSSLRIVGYGGAPAPPELRRRVAAALPTVMPGTGYGITECSSVISGAYGADYAERPDSAGLPIDICDVIAVDDQGVEVPPGELGELWVRGPNVVRGYWNQPEATAQVFTDGWFHTGDIGKIDAAGFVFIVDRKKDMIIRGGENVYCAEVEAVLLECVGVKSVAVIGLPHAALGEEVGAVVQIVSALEVTADRLEEYARRKLAAYKVPSKFWLRTEPLPLSASGKILKRELREEAART
jgi:long-chain acyl-CoA synthetase